MEDHGARTRLNQRRDARPTWEDWAGVYVDMVPLVCPACYEGLDLRAGEHVPMSIRLMEKREAKDQPLVYTCSHCGGMLTMPTVASTLLRSAPFDRFSHQ